jgi:hypothetical protein
LARYNNYLRFLATCVSGRSRLLLRSSSLDLPECVEPSEEG